MIVGRKVRVLRELIGYSQDFMSIQLEISQATYSRIENENTRVDIRMLMQIAEILNIDLISMLEFDEVNIFQTVKMQQHTSHKDDNNGFYDIRILKLEEKIERLYKIIYEAKWIGG